jgi:hypothetical protein
VGAWIETTLILLRSQQTIEPWQDGNKYVVNFTNAPQKIGPIKLVQGGKVKQLQNSRYASLDRLKNAKNLDEAF